MCLVLKTLAITLLLWTHHFPAWKEARRIFRMSELPLIAATAVIACIA